MPFTVILLPGDIEASFPAYTVAVEESVRATGGRMGPGGVVRLPDGGTFVFENDDFQLTALSPDLCRVIFDTAVRTNTFITNGGGGADLAPLNVTGSTPKTPTDLGRTVPIAGPAALCSVLQGRLARWDRWMTRARKDRIIGLDDQYFEPPPSPGDEPRLPSDTSGVAARCESQGREMAARLGWKFVRSIVTRNDDWGVVWRADVAPEADPSTWIRESCWLRHGPGGQTSYGVSSRPLRMVDQSQSIGPLPTN
ncbi:hypothetical protein ACO2Q3_12215 [Caulobacter sp. KR2-114]|uniref:hypothetical protein n=1 Tax=Caulobacter sp. KR2-114 TaxID=3400912 RepID=UPI003C0F895B